LSIIPVVMVYIFQW